MENKLNEIKLLRRHAAEQDAIIASIATKPLSVGPIFHSTARCRYTHTMIGFSGAKDKADVNEKAIEALNRTVQRLQDENAALKQNQSSNVKHMETLKELKKLKLQQLNQLEGKANVRSNENGRMHIT